MAEEKISIDKAAFHDRLSSFIKEWKSDKRDSFFGGAHSLLILVGKANGDPNSYNKAAAFQLWLLGYEFPATLLLILGETLHVVTTKKKAAYLEPLKGGKVPLEIHIRGKDAEENTKQFEKIAEHIKTAGKKLGLLTKETPLGPFADEWKKVSDNVLKDSEEVDIASGISNSLAVKDEKELRSIRDAARASSALFQKYMIEEMSQMYDNEVKCTHKQLADKVMAKIEDDAFFARLKVSSNFDARNLDWGLPPTIQSGKNFDLKWQLEPDNRQLAIGVVVLALGLRYSNYGAQLARTYLIDPTKSQEANYKLLLSVHQEALKHIKDGVATREVYNKAVSFLRHKQPDFEKHFPKNIGYGIGIESKDSSLFLSAKNTRTLKDGMTLLVTTSLSDLVTAEGRTKGSKYSLIISDTVRVTAAEPALFTKEALTEPAKISFFFGDSEEEEEAKPKSKRDNKIGGVASGNIQKTRLRAERTTNQDAEKEAARREHQKELHAKKQKEGLDQYGQGTGALNGQEEKKFKKFESYKQNTQFPSRVKDLIILVDSKNSTVLVPIMGRPVPFHINTIKNATHSPEGEFTSLRINFLSPGQGVGRKDDLPFEDPTAHFVRSLTFRSRDIERIDEITRQITDLKKDIVRRENEKKQMEDVVEQDKLALIKNRKPYTLDLVYLRPAMSGKRMPGLVEIQQNGLRYHHGLGGSGSSNKVDILFSNIKHLFFQPCQHELIVIIHVHLKNPIMIDKKKTKDVQFYREATDMQFDETGNRRRKQRYGDEEEFEAEQEERRRRAELDKQFKSYAEKIADAGRHEQVSVDVPFRELGFNGVPARSSVLVQPTTDCLVQLTEPPFLCLTLSEIEVVHLERVQFGLKNFDMVLIFKDFNRAPAHINTIPVESLDAVKDWLDSCEIPFSEGPLNLNWAPIMKTVTSDPHAFFVDGGWNFLQAESDAEDNGDEEEQESDFEMDESDFGSESESEDESDFDENASAEASEEDEDMSGDSEGEDWDELERKADKADKNRTKEDEGGKPSGKSSGKSSGKTDAKKRKR